MKIVILGSCGSGKTTLAKQLAQKYQLPHVELDALHWKPNWVERNAEDFQKLVSKSLLSGKWVVDGNYSRAGHDLIWPHADYAIWLDYPLYLILFRLLNRICRRTVTKEVLWSGCKESLRRQFLSRESIFVYTFKSYWKRKRIYPYMFSKYPHLKFYRVRSPKELEKIPIVASLWKGSK